MAEKKVSKLKVNDIIKVTVLTPTKPYISWAKITRIDKLRYYNNNAAVLTSWEWLKKVYYKPLSGKCKGKEICHYFNDDWAVLVPSKLGKIWRILNILKERDTSYF